MTGTNRNQLMMCSLDCFVGSGSSNWTSSLRIAETVRVNHQIHNISSLFSIRNVQFSMSASAGTVITSATSSGAYITTTAGSTLFSFTGTVGTLAPGAIGTAFSLLQGAEVQ